MNDIDALVADNLNLVRYVIKKYYRKDIKRVGYEDLFQLGCIGLFKAAQAYDESMGLKFSTLASRAIYRYIDRNIYIRKRLDAPSEVLSLDYEYCNDDKNSMSMHDYVADSRFEEDLLDRIDIHLFLGKFSDTDRRIAELVMMGYHQREIAVEFGWSRQYISARIKGMVKYRDRMVK